MKRLVSISLSVFIFLCMLVATERQAYGYVDPGSGLIALQGLASAAAAFGYFMRRRIGLLFRGNEITKADSGKEGKSANAA